MRKMLTLERTGTEPSKKPRKGLREGTGSVLEEEGVGRELSDSDLDHVRAMVKEKVDCCLPRYFAAVASDFQSPEQLSAEWGDALVGLFIERCVRDRIFEVMSLEEQVQAFISKVIVMWRRGEKEQIRGLLQPFQHP